MEFYVESLGSLNRQREFSVRHPLWTGSSLHAVSYGCDVKLNTYPPPRGNIKNSQFHTITVTHPSYSKAQLATGLSLRVGLLAEQRTPGKSRREQRSNVFSDVTSSNVVENYQLYQGTVCCPRWREQIAAKRPDYTATHSRRQCSLAERSGNVLVSDSEVNFFEAGVEGGREVARSGPGSCQGCLPSYSGVQHQTFSARKQLVSIASMGHTVALRYKMEGRGVIGIFH